MDNDYDYDKEDQFTDYIYDIPTSNLINFLSLDNKDHLGGLIFDFQKVS